jgi:Transposase DDE domain
VAEQILDSTPMLGAAAVQDTGVLVRAAARKLLDAVSATDRRAAKELRSVLGFNYSRPRVKPEGDWQGRDARMGLLVEVAMDAARALRAVETDPELIAAGRVAEAARLLGEIIGEEFDVGDDELPRARRGRGVRQIVSAHDPQMRHGRKTPSRQFTGYKLHAAAATETRILTAIVLSPGNERDGHHAGALIDQQPDRRRPKRVIGDTAYGNVEARELIEQRQVAVLAPVHSTSPRANRRTTSGERVARFAREDCEPCPLRSRCAPGGQRDIRIRRREDLRRKSTFQAVWTAVLVNLHPIGAALRNQAA